MSKGLSELELCKIFFCIIPFGLGVSYDTNHGCWG